MKAHLITVHGLVPLRYLGPGEPVLLADRPVGCACEAPVQVFGNASQQVRTHDAIETDAHCNTCKKLLGRLVVTLETLFGLEEDEAVMQRARIYG